MKHLDEEALTLYHYGELPGRAAAAAHVRDCVQCSKEYERLSRVLAAVDTFEAPKRSEGYGREMWARVRPHLEEDDARNRVGWFAWPHLAFASGLAVLVLAAFFVGRVWPSRSAPIVATTTQTVTAPSRDRVLMVAIGDHLERSQMVLIELVNREPSATVDISSEQAWAGDLVAASRLYRQTAVRDGETALADVLDDLERVLVEVANSPSMLSSMEFEQIRQRIEAQGILFKVRIVGSGVQQRESASPTSSKVS